MCMSTTNDAVILKNAGSIFTVSKEEHKGSRNIYVHTYILVIKILKARSLKKFKFFDKRKSFKHLKA